jgi:hypothetical protein
MTHALSPMAPRSMSSGPNQITRRTWRSRRLALHKASTVQVRESKALM